MCRIRPAPTRLSSLMSAVYLTSMMMTKQPQTNLTKKLAKVSADPSELPLCDSKLPFSNFKVAQEVQVAQTAVKAVMGKIEKLESWPRNSLPVS